MGVYDFYKGSCPRCGKKFGYDEDGSECGDIQTKEFVGGSVGNCFRTFTVGTKNRRFPVDGTSYLQDPCPHCNTVIVAVFKERVLVRFEER